MGASYLALAFGGLYFVYALKYYVSIVIALNLFNKESEPKADTAPGGEAVHVPFVSIHLPFFNEVNVARRILNACIDLDYTNYEVLVADDSRDTTLQVLRDPGWRLTKPIIKFVHRKDRSGYKGGALQQALRYMHPDAEYVVVFDADFVPPPDILRRFLSEFRRSRSDAKPVAAVQGYQLHHLNKNENWLTKGVRAEFSGSYMVERVAEEALGAMKMISGSVFMLNAELLRLLGWTTSITEDWELTLRLYLEGYRVAYTPLIQAPAEIPNTVRRLVRQRMRWAEGHTYAVRRYFRRVIRSKKLTLSEKLEFLYFAPYYLQSAFFIVGTLCWIISETSRRRPPFWTPTLGWGLIVSNFLAIPLMGLAGVFLEGDLREDYGGVFSFMALSYIVTPYQAYAALKGLLEGEEGNWIRTLKTGNITDSVLGVKVRSLLRWLRQLNKAKDIAEAGSGVTQTIKVPVRRLLTAASVILMLLPFMDRLLSIKSFLLGALVSRLDVLEVLMVG
ncbi:glycosyltransferase [Candidatus Bathyarchaeota archaeon]|nr:glycosyltransferase [Candidatus Bathyarchaeota archaeon]